MHWLIEVRTKFTGNIMAHTEPNVLIIDTNSADNGKFNPIVNSSEFKVATPINTLEDAYQKLEPNSYDVVIIVINPSDHNVLEALMSVIRDTPYAEVIVIGGDSKDVQRYIEASEVFVWLEKLPDKMDLLKAYIISALNVVSSRRVRTDLFTALNESETLSEVGRILVEKLTELTKADSVYIYLLSNLKPYLDGSADSEQYPTPSRLIRTRLRFEPVSTQTARRNDPIRYSITHGRPLKYDSLIRDIVAQSKPRIYPDFNNKKNKPAGWDDEASPDVESWIALPLVYNHRPVAIITINKSKPITVSTNDLRFRLQQIAGQAAVAIRTAQYRAGRDCLNRAFRAIAESNNLDEALNAVCQQAVELVAGDQPGIAYILLPNRAETHLECRAIWPPDHRRALENIFPPLSIEPHSNEEGTGLAALAYKRRRIVLINNQEEENSVKGLYGEDTEAIRAYREFPEQQFRTQSNIAIPIFLKDGSILGILGVEHPDWYAFTESHLRTLNRLAEYAAFAIRIKNCLGKPYVAPKNHAEIFVDIPYGERRFESAFRAIQMAGERFGLRAERAKDRIDNRLLIEKMLTMIGQCKYVVADLTGANPNVLYELGYAHALGKRVLLLARQESEGASTVDRLPFDVRGYDVVMYHSEFDLIDIISQFLISEGEKLNSNQQPANAHQSAATKDSQPDTDEKLKPPSYSTR